MFLGGQFQFYENMYGTPIHLGTLLSGQEKSKRDSQNPDRLSRVQWDGKRRYTHPPTEDMQDKSREDAQSPIFEKGGCLTERNGGE